MGRRAFQLVLSVCLAGAAAHSAAAAGVLEVVLDSAPYTMVDLPGGQKIVMPGFDYLMDPGMPMLPEIEALVLLPPGARASEIEVEEIGAERLPGRYAIVPAPSMLFLAGAGRSEELSNNEAEYWRTVNEAAYASDEAYPRAAVRMAGSGTLRKYAYVRLAYSPFTYHASSGRLVHRAAVRVRVLYSLPETGSAEEQFATALLSDTVADDRAPSLFANYDSMEGLYATGDGSLEDGRAVADFVIITTPALAAAIMSSDFQDWKSSLGFTVRTVLTTDTEITEQGGVDLAEQIRNFLRAYYVPWEIRHVLLVGNYLDVPMRYCYPDPDNHIHDPADPGTGPGSVPTDAYYADLSFPDAESWDLDGDGFHGEYGQDMPDFIAEVNVGRIPTSTASRITYTLNKMVRYEQDTGAWKRNALHAGAVLFFTNQNRSGNPFRDGAVTVAEIESHFMQGWALSRYSEHEGLESSTYPWPQLSLMSFLSDWKNGMYGIVNWSGHGWPDGVARTIWSWDDGDGVPETDGSDNIWSDYFISDHPALFEDDYPSIVCAVSCDVGYPDPNPYGNVGINLLTDPSNGAAAGIVSSTRYAAVSSDWPALPGGAESLCYEFNRYMIAPPDELKSLGEALYQSKFYSHLHYGWDRHYEYRNMYNYNLYGDPSMEWSGAGVRTGNLLRNTEVRECDPVVPPLDGLLPLDPTDDLYVPGFVSGEIDPDSSNSAPLIFYSVDAPVRIYLMRTSSGEIRIEF